MEKTIVGFFDNCTEAQAVVQDMVNSGFLLRNISLVMNDSKGKFASYGTSTQGTPDQTSGAVIGVGLGAVIGGIGGLLVGLGVLTIPGTSRLVAAGPLASAIAGVGVGAAAGGFIGTLIDVNTPQEEASYHTEGERRGGVQVKVKVNDNMIGRAVDIMRRHNIASIGKRTAEKSDVVRQDIEETRAPLDDFDFQQSMTRQDIEEIRASMTEKLELLEERVRDTLEETKTAVGDIVESVKGTVDETVDAVKETVDIAKSSVENIVENVKGTMDDTATMVKQSFDLQYQVELFRARVARSIFNLRQGISHLLSRQHAGGPQVEMDKQPFEDHATDSGSLAEFDPPRSAFALLQCPDVVIVQQEFELAVGLSPSQSLHVIGEELVRPSSSVGPYTLTVQVIANGFALRRDESWRNNLTVTAEAPYPTFALHLTSEPQKSRIEPRAIQAMYSVDGHKIGMAVRSVAVVQSTTLVTEATSGEHQEPGIDISIPTNQTAPDLTVSILADELKIGGLLWTLETPFSDIDVPDEAVKTNIGADPQVFARQLMQKINLQEGQPGLYEFLKGNGLTIAGRMPDEFWATLRTVSQKVGGPPTVLILSAEPYIPWELAVLDGPLFDSEAPPFLGAQAHVGRWVLGSKKPKLPPPSALDVSVMAVVSGVYNKPGWRRLQEAEAEAAQLGEVYGALPVKAVVEDVLKCLKGTPEAELLHFAVHGNYDPNGVQDGLVLIDGRFLDPMLVRGTLLEKAPLVFLNACQVGSGNKILGDYAGMAEAFLYAGASAVIAPLWSIKDTVAKDIALEFYKQTFDGSLPTHVLRTSRALFKESSALSATYLAYQFFGHPALKLHRTKV